MKKGIFKFINLVSVGLIFVNGTTTTKPTKTIPAKPIETIITYRSPGNTETYDTYYMKAIRGTDIIIDCFNEVPDSNVICDLDKKCYNYDHSFNKNVEINYNIRHFKCNVYTGMANNTAPTTTDKLYPLCKPTYSSTITTVSTMETKIPCTTNVGEDRFKTITCSELYKKETYYSTGRVCKTYTSDPEYFYEHKLTVPPTSTTTSTTTSTPPPPTTTLPPLPPDHKYTTLEVIYKDISPFTTVVAVPTDVIDVYYYGCYYRYSFNPGTDDPYAYFDIPQEIPQSNKYICDSEDCISLYSTIGNGCRLYTLGPNEPKPTSTVSNSNETTVVNVLCHTSTRIEKVPTIISSANYSVTTVKGDDYNTHITQYTSMETFRPRTGYYCGPKTKYSSSSPTPTPTPTPTPAPAPAPTSTTSTTETSTTKCPRATKLGYKCCTDCNTVYEDDDGRWGVEDGEWCGISEQCYKGLDICWSVMEGYPCCDHCDPIYEDESGSWGIMNEEWCGIPSRCK